MKKNDWNKKKFIGCILFLAMCIACSRESAVVNDLRCEYLVNPLSVDTPHPRLGWKLAGNERGLKQTAYQILVATAEKRLQEGEADLWDSGRTLSENQVSVRYAGQDLTGRKLVYWKVRIWRNGGGKPSAWSETACFGAGLTEKELQAADYIAFPEDKLSPEEKEAGITSPLLRKRFEWEKEGKALLYVNSLGYHEVYVNGAKAGEQALAPAVSQFDRRSLYLTYDVTSLLKKGSNDLVIWLGAGWYEPGLPGVVHKGPAVKALLEVNRQGEWASLIRTDGQWQCAESGYTSLGTWRPHQFGGERMDAPAVSGMKTAQLDRLKWYPVEKVNVPAHAVTPQMAENDFVAEEISPVNIRQLSDSVWIADMGKVFTGRAKIKFHNQPANREIRLHYSDHLNREATRRDERLDGEDIVNQNQYDSYRASGKSEETFCSRFNYHCFRYIQLSGLSAAPLPEDITGQVIHTGNMRQSSFQCSDTDMNAIHGLVQWTLRNLTVNGYQVDCTHQERLGYGGDGLSSAVTAQTMFSLAPTYANWLAAWSDCLRPDGGLPHTAPCPYQAGGGPYWCGFVILSPWSLYLQYGDLSSLEKYYPVMRQWLGYVEQYKVEGLLQRWPEVDYRNHGWYLGDWAAPAGVNVSDPGSVEIITNSFIRICYHTMEKIARLLGKEEDARLYAQQSDTLKTLINERCFDAGKNIYGSGSQADLALSMLADIPSPERYPLVRESLYAETARHNGHIACGLAGVPVITEWSIRNHAPDFIYSMLKKRDYPGYLYMIDRGGTAVWEHWNGDRSRLHNCYNGIGSWFYQAVGGIRPDENSPGYKNIIIEPQIPRGITWAKTAKETPYGTVVVNWELKNGRLELDVTIPPGSTASLPLAEDVDACLVNGQPVEKPVTLESGKYAVSYPFNNVK